MTDHCNYENTQLIQKMVFDQLCAKPVFQNSVNIYRANFFNSVAPIGSEPTTETKVIYNGDWGVLEVDPWKLRKICHAESFYVNVVGKSNMQNDWLVRNLYIQTDPTKDYPTILQGSHCKNCRCHDSNILSHELKQLLNCDVSNVETYFALTPPSSTTFNSTVKINNDQVLLSIVLTKKPVPDEHFMSAIVSTLNNFVLFDIELKLDDAQGDIDESVDPSTIRRPLIIRKFNNIIRLPLIPVITPTTLVTCTWVQLPFAVNKHSSRNQCVSIAHSNCMGFLKSLYGFANPSVSLPKPHTEGLRPDSVFSQNNGGDNSLVGKLDSEGYMDRENPASMITRASSTDVDGLTRTQQINGLFKCFSENTSNFPIVGLDHADGSVSYMASGVTSNRTSNKVTFEWVVSRLNEGKAVYMSFGRYSDDELNIWSSGHAVRIIGAGQCAGIKTFRTLDDGNQSNDASGLRTQDWDVTQLVQGTDAGGNVDPNQVGRIRLNGTNWIILFSIAYKINAPPPVLSN